MRVSIQLMPAGQIREYEVTTLPRVGEVLDLSGTTDELAWAGPLYVAQIVHAIGPEAPCQRVTLRVMPLGEVPDYPGRGCTTCLRGIL